MKFILSSCVLWVLASAVIDGPSILYPGYVVNYDTPRGSSGSPTTDLSYAYLPVTGVTTPVNLTVAMKIIEANAGSTPSATVRWERNSIPTELNSAIILGPTGSSASFVNQNTTNEYYFLSVTASCTGTTCDKTISTELSAWTPSYSQQNWPPYMVVDQRRTAKYYVSYQKYLYFWLAVTDDLVKTNRKMKLYIRVDFTTDESASAIQALAFVDNGGAWPSAVDNVTIGAVAYFPEFVATTKGDWAMGDGSNDPLPFLLSPGLYQICFFNPISGHPAQYTAKFGFNQPAKDAAPLTASMNLFGFIVLSLACIVAQKKL